MNLFGLKRSGSRQCRGALLLLPILLFILPLGYLGITQGQTPKPVYTASGISIVDTFLSSDARFILVSVESGDGYEDIVGIKDGTVIWTTGLSIYDLDMAEASNYAAVANSDGNLALLSCATGKALWSLKVYPTTLDLSSDGKYLVSNGEDRRIRLFSENGSPLWQSIPINGSIRSLSVADDGKSVIAVTDIDSTHMRVYLLDQSGIISSTTEHSAANLFSSYWGRYIVASYSNGLIMTNKLTGATTTYQAMQMPTNAAVTKDGQYLAIGNIATSSTAYLFTKEGNILVKHPIPQTINAINLTPDGQCIVAGSSSGTFYLINVDGKVVSYPLGSPISSIAVSSNARYTAVSTYTGVYLFETLQTPVQLTITTKGSGTTTPISASYMYNYSDKVTIEAKPNDGWRFDHWEESEVNIGTTASYTATMNTTRTIVAVFVETSKPAAHFTYTPTNPSSNQEVTFDASGSTDDGVITGYSWDFGDGTSGVGITCQHTYLSSGNFTVTLTLVDDENQTNSIANLISVSVTKLTVTISINVSPSNFPLGQSTVITGNLNPPQSGASITLQSRTQGGDWVTIGQAIADDSGSFSYTWSPTEKNSYEIKAVWGGSEDALAIETEILQIEVQEGTGPDEVLIVTVIIGVSVLSAAIGGFFVYQGSHPKNILKKTSKKVSKSGYQEVANQINKLNAQSHETFNSRKIWRELDKEPYTALKNIQSYGEELSQTGISPLRVNEATEYLSYLNKVMNGLKGVSALSETDATLKAIVAEFDENKGHSDSLYAVTFYNNVDGEIRIEGPSIEKDIWYCWGDEEDFEPVKIFFKDGKVNKALCRWHWKHFSKWPYCDGEGRVEVLILPRCHTPVVREKTIVQSAIFALFVKECNAMIKDPIAEYKKIIEEYYWKPGEKWKHKPTVNYPGWDLARLK